MKLKSISRILLIRFGSIGDVLLSTPAVYALRRHFPRAHITYLTGTSAKNVLLNNPDIDEILVYSPRIYRKIIADKAYDLLLNFVTGPYSEMLCFLSRARYRLGPPNDEKNLFSKNTEIYNINHDKLSPSSDVVDYFLDFIKALGLKAFSRKTRLYLTEEEKNFAKRYLEQHNLEGRAILGIQPGGRESKIMWGTKNFTKLVDRMTNRYRFAVLIFQGPGEEFIAQKVYDNVKQKQFVYLVPVLTFRKYISLINVCGVFIAHDRGPMHISASLGVKTVGIFTSLSAPYWFPYQENKYCTYLQKSNVKDITVEKVLRAVRRVNS